jgi:hypothetical protein
VKTSTETLIAAMRIFSRDIISDDGVTNAFIAEAAQRLEEQQDRIKRLEEAGDALEYISVILEGEEDPNGFEKLLIAQREWRKAKEAKL